MSGKFGAIPERGLIFNLTNKAMKNYQCSFQISGATYSFNAYDIPEQIATLQNESGLLQFLADKYGNGKVDSSGNTFGAVREAFGLKQQ